MRTIKFKGKCLKNGKWVYGSLVNTPFGTRIEWYEGCGGESFCEGEQVISATVCQFTGFRDKDGYEIYEGDVLRSDKYPFCDVNYFGIVFYYAEKAKFRFVTVKNPQVSIVASWDGIYDDLTQKKLRDFEVVGNIHEDEWKYYREYLQTKEEKAAEYD